MMEIETSEQIIHIERKEESSLQKGFTLLIALGAILGGWYLFHSLSKEMLIERIMRLWIRIADEKEMEFDDDLLEHELSLLSLNDLRILAEYHELFIWEKKANQKNNSMRKRRSMEKKIERLEKVKSSYDFKGIEDKIDLTAINYIIED